MRTILLIALGLGTALALFVLTRPNTVHYERSATIQAPPEAIFPHIDDLHQMAEWSPWEKVDPKVQVSYDGPIAGVGAGYHWKGNQELGEGSMKITHSTPSREVVIAIVMDMDKMCGDKFEEGLATLKNRVESARG